MSVTLSEISTRAPKELDKIQTKEKMQFVLDELDELQNLLYAENKNSLLVIIQGMDASGKDGVIKNVFGTLNPLGIQVKPFKVPTEEEAAHDFLWRVHQHAPRKGMIQLFNRSHYESVLVTRVHKWIDEETVHRRFKSINAFEKLIVEDNQTQVLKFYLHISPEKQQERLQERISDIRKQWKYNENDFKEARLWNNYMKAYEDVFEQCGEIPWIIVPADQNWYKEYFIATTVRDRLKQLEMQYPGMKKE
jgi:PPK2 family polyphosphate:nucleotide phosphotransferase